MFDWAEKVGLKPIISKLRFNPTLQSAQIPEWIKYSLPDALWLFSFTYLMMLLWDFTISKASVFWVFLAPAIGVLSEIGQWVGMIPGTFDIVDLILLLVAGGLPFLKTVNYKPNN